MKTLLLTLVVLLAGCATKPVPVTVSFPALPETLAVSCAPLKKIPEDAKLSDIAKTVAENYKQYHVCSENNDGLIDWYKAQRKIFGEVK